MNWKPLSKRVLVKLYKRCGLVLLDAADGESRYTGEGEVIAIADDVLDVDVGNVVILPQRVASNPLLDEDTALVFAAELLAKRDK